jgi:hypothetical protein
LEGNVGVSRSFPSELRKHYRMSYDIYEVFVHNHVDENVDEGEGKAEGEGERLNSVGENRRSSLQNACNIRNASSHAICSAFFLIL